MLCCSDIIPTILYYLNTKESISYLITCKELYRNMNNIMKLRLTIGYNINFDETNIVNISRWLDLNTECINNLSKYVDINKVLNMVMLCNDNDVLDKNDYVVNFAMKIIPLFANNTLFDFDDITTNFMNIKVIRIRHRVIDIRVAHTKVYKYPLLSSMSNCWDKYEYESVFHDLVRQLAKNTFILGIPIIEIFKQINHRKSNDNINEFKVDVLQIIYNLKIISKIPDIHKLIDMLLLMKRSY